MKILFCNRRKSLWVGGDYVQLEKTADALRKLGIEVDISEEYVVSPETIKKYDIVHLWNFSMEWTRFQLWVARKHKKPTVCSMIYHESDQWISWEHQQIMLDELSAQIYLTESEKERVKRHLTNKGNQYVIPNGLDEIWLKRLDIPKEEFCLSVGRLEGNKGQLQVAYVCKKLGIKYVCIGGISDEEYANDLEALGAIVIPDMSHEELIKWYAKAKVFALVSKAEVFPLTVMEAMSQDCQIVLTDASEWKPDVIYAKYNDLESIEKALQEAFKQNRVYAPYIRQFTWDTVALQLQSIYESIRQ